MTYNVSCGTLNPTHSLTHSLYTYSLLQLTHLLAVYVGVTLQNDDDMAVDDVNHGDQKPSTANSCYPIRSMMTVFVTTMKLPVLVCTEKLEN